ncbi:MAG: hypothetical protein HY730_00250 [Candidatus Tectomicrobia bacterium]|uniref:Uncharacterized protein n=1 Tax=Tectimicrobiota bacterium TaxID=2528274 RepID=A0A933GJW9_UNCTE|nr:hypothetical protein [Candidatus Tectomicrobia bacterium]
MREAGGLQSLASLTEARAEIDTSAQRSAIDTIRSNGFTPSDFGGQQGFMEAARTVAAMEAIKGGKLTNSELKASMETGILSEVGRNQAIDQASKTMGLDPKSFERVLKNWEGINEFQKFHMEQIFADRIGVSFPKLEAYKNSFMELSVPSGGLGQLGKEPNGLGDLSDIKADHRAEGYENLKKAGFDLENINNDSGAYSEAAKITGLMRHIKGEDLTQKELSMANSGGLFSESGLKQAIGKVSKAVGMEEKDLNNALNHWKCVSQFMELADSQGTMSRVWGLDLPSISEYKKNFEKMAAEPAPERAGADQSGKVSLAFTPDGKGGLEIVQQTRRAGTETKVGDFATSGHEAER